MPVRNTTSRRRQARVTDQMSDPATHTQTDDTVGAEAAYSFAQRVSEMIRRPAALPMLLVVLLLAILPTLNGGGLTSSLIVFGTLAPVAVSFLIVLSLTGEMSMAQGTFFGIGGYTAAALYEHYNVSLWIGTLAGAAVCSLIAAILGLVALSVGLRGLYFAIFTLAFAEASGVAVTHMSILNGAYGIYLPVETNPLDMLFAAQGWYIALGLVITAASLGIAIWLGRSKLGLNARIARSDEKVATACGIRPVVSKVVIFALAAPMAAVGGAVYAASTLALTPTVMFDLNRDFEGILACLLGSMLTPAGPVVGTLFVVELSYLTVSYLNIANLNTLVFGVILVLVALLLPDGILGRVRTLTGLWEPHAGLKDPGPGRAPSRMLAPRRPQPRVVLDRETSSSTTPAASERLLDGTALWVSYGRVDAVRGVDFSLDAGEVLGLVGPNGAGKTSLFNGISGHGDLRGVLRLSGSRIDGRQPWARSRLGIGRTFQIPSLARELTVEANVSGGDRHRLAPMREMLGLERIIELLQLGDLLDRKARELSLAEFKRVELARALARQPKVLLLDETMAGISRTEQEGMVEVVKKLRATGLGIIYVEHRMDIVRELVDRLMVLDRGVVLCEGAPEAVLSDERTRQAYLGSAVG